MFCYPTAGLGKYDRGHISYRSLTDVFIVRVA